eukprot:2948139-Prymnesium_polylepis.1
MADGELEYTTLKPHVSTLKTEQLYSTAVSEIREDHPPPRAGCGSRRATSARPRTALSLIHISEPTRRS